MAERVESGNDPRSVSLAGTGPIREAPTPRTLCAPITSCPFCDYKGPKQVLLDSGDCIIFEPLNPVTPGHVLVVPKVHAVSATDHAGITSAVMFVAASYAHDRGYDCNLITSVGPAATQTVKHLHIHIIPRREGDGLMLPWSRS